MGEGKVGGERVGEGGWERGRVGGVGVGEGKVEGRRREEGVLERGGEKGNGFIGLYHHL